MSELKSFVGKFKFVWKSIPRGPEGHAQIEVSSPALGSQLLEVHWRKDQDGIWLSLPHGCFGFDLRGEQDDSGKMVFQILERGGPGDWGGATVAYGSNQLQTSGSGGKSKVTRIRAQMPGKIIRILVEAGQEVQKDQPVVVMEAMKMENEIRATQPGKIREIKVMLGQAVETGADLILLD